MLRGRQVSVVVPAYNEETQIRVVITTMPDFVDRIVVVDDCSRDGTVATVEALQSEARFQGRLILLRFSKNQGVGGAIAEGYKWARDNAMDVAAVMAGDGQMNPSELERIVTPVLEGLADYVKGNRLLTENSWRTIPRSRFIGNAALSMMTKIVSGYWSVVDSQTGYTAISLRALKTLNLDNIYKRYGMPNDMLVKLNIYGFRLAQIPIEPVYNVGERSKMKLRVVIFTIPWLLFRLFFYRLFYKYVVRDFHPIFFFYSGGLFFFLLGFLGGFTTLVLDRLLAAGWITGVDVSYGWMIFFTILFMSGLNLIYFGMWLDRDENKDLQLNVLPESRQL